MPDSLEISVDDSAVRISLRLTPAARLAVDKIKALGGFDTIQEALRRAISDELFLLEERKEGWTVLLRKGNKYREVIWPSPAV